MLLYLVVHLSSVSLETLAYFETPMMVSAVFAGLCVDVDFNLNLPQSVTSNKDLSRRGLLSMEFDGV